MAYAERVKNPQIRLITDKGNDVTTLTMAGVFGVKAMSFSQDGQWLYALGGLPTFRLSAFDMNTFEEVTYQTYTDPIGQKMSVSPMNPRLMAVYGDDPMQLPPIPSTLGQKSPPHLRFITLEGARKNYLFTEVVSEINVPVLSLDWTPNETCVVSTNDGRIIFVDPATGKIIGEPFNVVNLGDKDQTCPALLCTSKYIIASGSSGHIYWLPINDLGGPSHPAFAADNGQAVTSLQFFPGSNILVYGREDNSLLSIELDPDGYYVDDSAICLREGHWGPVTAMCALPHHLVTADAHGMLRFWGVDQFMQFRGGQSFPDEHFSSMAASPGGSLVAVGSQSGVVRIVNTKDADHPKLLYREKLHSTSVSAITISPYFIISGSDSGTIVILKNDPQNLFPLIGLLQLRTAVVSLTTPKPLENVQQLLIATSHREVIRIDLPEEPADDFRLGIETMNRAMLKVSNKISQIVAEPELREDSQYFFCACDDKSVRFFCMPVTTGNLDIVGNDDVETSAPDDTFVGHAKAVTALSLSPSRRFIASGCAGGEVIVREQDVNTAQVKLTHLNVVNHDPFHGTITSICFSPDETRLFTAGIDGSINSYTVSVAALPINSDSVGISDEWRFKTSISRVFEIESQLKHLNEMWVERQYEIAMSNDDGEDNGFAADDGCGNEETALIDQMKAEQLKPIVLEKDEFQGNMRQQLRKIQEEFNALVEANESAPELEKLSQQDFTLDVASADRLTQVGKVRAELVRYRRRVKNQIRQLKGQVIKQECFTPFEPKLTSLFSIKTPIHMDNFPLPVLTDKQKRMLACVTLLRRTEIAALRYKPPSNDPNRVGNSMSRDSSLDGARYLSSRMNSLVQLTQSESAETEIIVKDDTLLLYDPFQLVTGNRKVTQILIVQHIIFEEMYKFNTSFDEMLGKKQSLVQGIAEKNKRIQQLVRLLKLNQEDYPIFEPKDQPDEIAESFLSVRDDEVHLKAGQDPLANTTEKVDDVDKDSFAERALRQMMGGNVNMNSIEEAPADDEPQRPEWMDTKKKEEMTEEEQYQVQEFDKKLKNFIEEREKRRKALNAELVKLVKGNASSIDEFDRSMAGLYMERFNTEEKVSYHELEILHLVISLDDERNNRKKLTQIQEEIFNLGTAKRHKQPVLTELSAESATCTKQSQTLDEQLDSLKTQVNKEFSHRDCVQQLMRLYAQVSKREKPKVVSDPNPFREFIRPPFVFSDDTLLLAPTSKPATLAETPWNNFKDDCVIKRRDTFKAAEMATDAARMKALVKTYDTEMGSLEERLVALDNEQQALTESLLYTLVDIHVPFTFRQGQVEIPSETVLIDYDDVVLIEKKQVTDRNHLILEAGRKKLDELESIRQQRSNHKVLKWQIDRHKIELENLNEEVKEYQLFRVTKLDQELIMGGGKNRNQKEVNSLNNSLSHTQQTHESRIKRAQDTLKKLQAKINKKKQENDHIEEEILQMQLGLKERKRIYNIQMKSSEGANEARLRRLKQVMMISRLKRAKQVQEERIAELRSEVVRLRQSKFTSFNEGEDFQSGYTSTTH